VVPSSRFTRSASISGQALTGLVDARKVLALVDDGATVVLQGLHRSWPPIIELVARLERELGHPGQANAYLTPAGSQGFAPHVDAHDVFVVQTEGEKAWLIGDEGAEDEVLLTPGSVLYLPTGTRHSARSQRTHSLHVTIGINQLTWRALLSRAVLDAMAEVPDTHLPAGYLDDPTLLTEGLRTHLAHVGERLAALDAQDLVREHGEHFLTSRPPRLAGRLAEAFRAQEVTDDTRLVRRPTAPGVLVDGPAETVRVLLGDRHLDAPSWIRPALVDLLARTELRPSDLADLLDPQSRLVLCRRLVREGLLAIAR
jgi:lysine-specific demethylase/histidyl-hydroxylase NO66